MVRRTDTTTVDLAPASKEIGADPHHRSLRVRSFGLTDPGKVRKSNEDQFLVAQLTKDMQVLHTSLRQNRLQRGSEQSYLFLVADGMGGHAGGERASALAVYTIEEFMLDTFKWFLQLTGQEKSEVLAEFQTALRQADAKLFAEIERRPELRGMGTTVTMAYSLGTELFVAHVGDSRCYRLRDGKLQRLTRDHTLVQELVQAGQLSPEEAAQNPLRHMLTNVVGGTDPGLRVDVTKLHLTAGDRLLLCSDGLTEMVADDAITAALQAHPEPRLACEQLLSAANERGGRDNITVIVADFDAAD